MNDGLFTKNLLSLQLQLQTLVEGAGGNEACRLLDELSELSGTEQGIILHVFHRVLLKLKESGMRIASLEDSMQAEFEECLYQELVDGITAWKRGDTQTELAVVEGGKASRKRPLPNAVCIKKARRRLRRAPSLS